MHAERDWLVKVVFPEVRDVLAKDRVHLDDVDLRWGVTQEQGEHDRALGVCLDQIEQCRPFFLGLLGERYGSSPQQLSPRIRKDFPWIEFEHHDKSITELEIVHGVLRDEEMRMRSLFCFRDAAFLRDVPPQKLSDVCEEPGSPQASALTDLRARITAAAAATDRPAVRLVYQYGCRYAGLRINRRIARRKLTPEEFEALTAVAPEALIDPRQYAQLDAGLQRRVAQLGVVYVAGLEDFGRRVRDWLVDAVRSAPELQKHYAALKAATVAEAQPAAAAVPPDEDESFHDEFIESRMRVYVGRDDLHRRLLDYLARPAGKPLLLTGASGSGKSAALARLCGESHDAATLWISHFVGAAPGSTDLRRSLLRFVHAIMRRFQLTEEVTEDFNGVLTAFRKLLENIPADKRAVFVVDGINQFDQTDRAHELWWLPRQLPANVWMIISCIDEPGRDQPLLERARRLELPEIPVDRLTPDEAREIIEKVPSLAAKSLDKHQIDLLLANPATANPLYLLVALEELRGFGSYEDLNTRIEEFREAPTPTELFIQVLERLEEDFRPSTVHDTLALMASAKEGLSDRELLDLIEGPGVAMEQSRSDLFPLLRQLRPYLARRSQLNDFFHRNLYKAVRQKYLHEDQPDGPAVRNAFHRRLADYFDDENQNPYFLQPLEKQRERMKPPYSARPVNIRKVVELPWQLFRLAEEAKAFPLPLGEAASPLRRSRGEGGLAPSPFAGEGGGEGAVSPSPLVGEGTGEGNLESAYQRIETLFTTLDFLEAKNEAGMVFDLAQDFDEALRILPQKRETFDDQRPETSGRRKLVRLLNEALRRYIDFIHRHHYDYPQGLFQCLWNSCWWYDCPEAAKHYHGTYEAPILPGPKIFELIERWHKERAEVGNHAEWLRALRPLPVALLSSALAIFHGPASQSGLGRTVRSVAFSPDDKLIAGAFGIDLGRKDNIICVWEVASGKHLRTFSGHSAGVTSVCFCSDGQHIVSGSHDRTLRIWDLSGGATSILHGHNSSVTCVACSGDGKWIASGSTDTTVRLWSTETGARRRCLCGHEEEVLSVAFSHDGARLVSASVDKLENHGSIRVWEVESACETVCIRFHDDFPLGAAFSNSNDGRIVSGSRSGTVQIWNSHSGAPLMQVRHGETPTSVCFSRDDRTLLIGACDGSISIRDAHSGQQLRLLNGHREQVSCVTSSRSGDKVLSGSFDDTVRLWHALSGTNDARLLGETAYLSVLGFSADGRSLLTSGSRVFVWDVRSGTIKHTLVGGASGDATILDKLLDNVHLFDGGRRIAIGSEIWNTETGDRLIALDRSGIRAPLIWSASPNGELLAAGSFADGRINVWNAKDGSLLLSLSKYAHRVTCLAFSPDGHCIAVGYDYQYPEGGAIRVWDVCAGEELGHCTACEQSELLGCIRAITFSMDGRTLVIGSAGALIDWTIGKPARYLYTKMSDHVWSLGTSPDKKLFAAAIARSNTRGGRYNNIIQIWKIQERHCVQEVLGSGDVNAIAQGSEKYPWAAISTHADTLICASNGYPVAIWPEPISTTKTHPTGRIWAGRAERTDDHVRLLELQSVLVGV